MDRGELQIFRARSLGTIKPQALSVSPVGTALGQVWSVYACHKLARRWAQVHLPYQEVGIRVQRGHT